MIFADCDKEKKLENRKAVRRGRSELMRSVLQVDSLASKRVTYPRDLIRLAECRRFFPVILFPYFWKRCIFQSQMSSADDG
jgi:hypothetical protein